MPFLDEISYLVTFCTSALNKFLNFIIFDRPGFTIVIGFFLIWIIIDNLVPKG